MIKNITKRMSIFSLALIAAITTICGVTGMTANKVSADETYSETWVIKESWDYSKTFSAEISGRVSDGSELEEYRKFGKFEIVDSSGTIWLNCGNFAISVVQDGIRSFQNIPQVNTMSYDEWKNDCGKITFYSDTSAAEYSELRAWLEQNATQIFVQVWYNGDIAQCVSVPLGTTYEQLDKTKAPKRAGYTCIGWSNEENGEVATGALMYSDSSGVLYIQVYPVYAKEAPAQAANYTLTFKDGEKVLYTLSVESGKAINLSEHPEINESADKTGYTFKGWATTQDGAVIVKNGYIPNVTADTTFYAVYSEGIEPTEPTNPDNPDVPESTSYKVVFLVDNLVVYTATVKNGKAVSFADYPELSEKIKKDGYTFKGWKIEGQDEIYTDGIPVQNKTTVLVAVYEKKVLGIDGVSKAGSIVLTAAIGIVGVYFLFKLFGGKRRRR